MDRFDHSFHRPHSPIISTPNATTTPPNFPTHLPIGVHPRRLHLLKPPSTTIPLPLRGHPRNELAPVVGPGHDALPVADLPLFCVCMLGGWESGHRCVLFWGKGGGIADCRQERAADDKGLTKPIHVNTIGPLIKTHAHTRLRAPTRSFSKPNPCTSLRPYRPLRRPIVQ